ncbi:MAG TPA: hypothetical protein PKE25_09565, partial [Novosphingobium sp.]|nr:hypothetical protein [Novosphingobium sp.]
MPQAEQAIAAARARRDAARAALDARIARFKPPALRARAVETARNEALGALETGLDVARESKGIIAGVIAALALWFMRRPLVAWLEALLDADDHAEQG